MVILALMVIFLVLIALEAPGLVRDKQWRELAAFSVLMVVAMALSFAQVLGLPIPNPNHGLEAIFTPIAEMIKKVLT